MHATAATVGKTALRAGVWHHAAQGTTGRKDTGRLA